MGDEWRPRAWRSGGGGVLVEGPAFALAGELLPPRTPGGEELVEERSYYLLDSEGGMERSYETTDWSVEYERGVSVHHVEGGSLLRLSAVYDDWSGDSRYQVEAVREGLVPLPAEEAPSAEHVRALAAGKRERDRAAGLRTYHSYWPEHPR